MTRAFRTEKACTDPFDLCTTRVQRRGFDPGTLPPEPRRKIAVQLPQGAVT